MALAELSGGYIPARPALGCGGCPALALARAAGVLTAGACGARAARAAQGGWVAERGSGRANGTTVPVARQLLPARNRETVVGSCGDGA